MRSSEARKRMTFFTQGQLEAIASVLGDTTDGLTNPEICFLFQAAKMVG